MTERGCVSYQGWAKSRTGPNSHSMSAGCYHAPLTGRSSDFRDHPGSAVDIPLKSPYRRTRSPPWIERGDSHGDAQDDHRLAQDQATESRAHAGYAVLAR